MFEKWTKYIIAMYDIMHYNKRAYEGMSEVNDDMIRVKYVKRLFHKYKESGILKERLLLNHIIILNNLFGAEASSTLLFFKTERQHWPTLRSFLEFLNIMPEQDLMEIQSDEKVKEKLMEL